ncbi:MAG: hypothetical protein H6636_04860 [Anaerolineales bacterium]|nr:hypothetical protein [Anaerolineales bacterium]
MTTDELLAYIFDGKPHPLSQPMAEWFSSSRSFVTFTNTFRDKIRKKIRVTQSLESTLDLRLELETAYLLLQEKALHVVYEPLQAGRTRSPDFAVSYTTSITFMVEVTRLRAEQKALADEPTQAQAPGLQVDERLADAICSKLGQLQPQYSNILLVGVDDFHLSEGDLRATMLHLQHRAEQGDAAFLQRYRFRSRGDFFQQFLRLSEVFVRATDSPGSLIVWVNPQAKSPLPGKVRTVLYRSHTV